ncbi:unnamed protein product [Caenorhabditis sp. 36 PRJEB53466]|nr:unnamed protein product [Caenorhabditis sp. 36 PRJEB53466]
MASADFLPITKTEEQNTRVLSILHHVLVCDSSDASCQICARPSAQRIKTMLEHSRCCHFDALRCVACHHLKALCRIHVDACLEHTHCPMVFCEEIKRETREHFERLDKGECVWLPDENLRG